MGLDRVPGEPAPYMRAVELPARRPRTSSGTRLFAEHRVEVPVYEWDGRRLLRVSIGPYNDDGDVTRLLDALGRCL